LPIAWLKEKLFQINLFFLSIVCASPLPLVDWFLVASASTEFNILTHEDRSLAFAEASSLYAWTGPRRIVAAAGPYGPVSPPFCKSIETRAFHFPDHLV